MVWCCSPGAPGMRSSTASCDSDCPMGFHANPGEDAGVPRRARRAGAWTATAGWHGIDWRHGGDLTATLDVSPFFYENLSLPPQSMMEVGFVAVGSRSLSSLAGSLWFLDGGHPPASRWGAADGVMVASPVASDLRSDCPLLSPNHRTPTRWHTATAAGSFPSLVGLRPLPELRPTLYRGRSLLCGVCV